MIEYIEDEKSVIENAKKTKLAEEHRRVVDRHEAAIYLTHLVNYEDHSKALAFAQGLYSKNLPPQIIKNILIFSAPKPLVEIVMIEMEKHVEITDLRKKDYTFDRSDKSYTKLIKHEEPKRNHCFVQ